MVKPQISTRIFYALFALALTILVICNVLVLLHLHLRLNAVDWLIITASITSYLVLAICFWLIIKLSDQYIKQNMKYADLEQQKLALIEDKMNAEELARSRLEFTLEAANMGYWDLNLKTMQTERSLKHDKIFGYQSLVPNWSYNTFLEHVHPEDKEWVEQKFRSALASQETEWELECRIIRLDRQVRRICAMGRFYRNASPPHLAGLISDTTEKRLADAHLTVLNTILESTTEYSIIPLDLNFNILGWNEGAKYNYGYDAIEIIGQNIKILSAPNDIQSGTIDQFLKKAKLKGKARDICERIRKNGTRFTADVSINATRDSQGHIIGYSLISRDVTEQKKIDERLRLNQRIEIEKNRIKSEFIANMSHELRTPLNAIMGFTQLMQLGDTGPLTSEQKEFLQEIMTNSSLLLQLINDVLDISKIEAGKLTFHNNMIDLQELVSALAKTFDNLLKEGEINFHYSIDENLKNVHSDPLRLKQVIFNFISNAIKFTPKNGTIQLRILDESPTMFRIEVEDTGIGIKPSDINKLFVEFEQLNHQIPQQQLGTGLGLALTKNIVEAQGGKVGVLSNPGSGSCFFAILPKYFNNTEVKLKSTILL